MPAVMATHANAPSIHYAQLRSGQRPFSTGRCLRSTRHHYPRHLRSQQQRIYALWGRGKQQPAEEPEEEVEQSSGLLGGLFGGAKKAAAEAEEVVQEPRAKLRAGSQRIKAQAQQSGVTRPRSAQEDLASQGTQRFSLKNLFGSGKRGGTARIGGRPGGTQVVGGKSRAKSGPRGLFGGRSGRRDENTVFVAGATGRLGARIVRQLLQQGFKVRAGVRDVEKAQEYLDTAIAYNLLPRDASRRVSLVEYDLSEPESITAAIGTAAKVVAAIGASDNLGVLNFADPKKVDGDGGVNLVKAATSAGIQHFVMVSSLATGKFGWPASVLNLFGGILIQKKRAEEALEASGLQYTIVRPGGMERPSDDYGETHALVFKPRDQLFGGNVSRLQVSQVVGTAIANSELAGNKVLEVVAERSAPRREIELLLADLPAEASQESRQLIAQVSKDAQEQLQAARDEQATLSQQLESLQERLSDMYDAVEDAPNQRAAKRAERDIEKASVQLEATRDQVADVRKQQEAAQAVLDAASTAAKKRTEFTAEQAEQIQQDIFDPPTPEELRARKDAEAKAKAEAKEAEQAERRRVADEARQAREDAAKRDAAAKEEKAAAEAKARKDAAAKRQREDDARKEAVAKKQREDDARKEAAAKKQREEVAERAKAAKAKKEAAEKADAEAKRKEAAAKADAEAKQKKAAADEKARKDAADKKQKEDAAKAKAAKEKEVQAAKAKAEAEAKREAEEKRAADEKAAQAKAAAERRAAAANTGRASAASIKAAEMQRADKQAKAAAEAAEQAAKQKSAAEKKLQGGQAGKSSGSASQATNASGDAQQWISNWRSKDSSSGSGNGASEAKSAGSGKPSESEKPAGSGPFSGFKWPWQQESVYADDPSSMSQQPQRESATKTDPRISVKQFKAAESKASEAYSNAAANRDKAPPSDESNGSGASDAREWIDNWRKRTK